MFHGREEQRKRLSDMINARGQMISMIYGACVKIGLNQEKPYK